MDDCSHENISKDPRLTSDALRRRFAAAWVASGSDYTIGIVHDIIGSSTRYDVHVSAWANFLWKEDPFVQAEMQRIRESQGDAGFIPSKEALAREALAIARDAGATRSEKLAALKLVNEFMGYTRNNGGVVGDIYTNSVMIVPDKGNPDDWSQSLVQQQRKLVSDANAAIRDDTDSRTTH